MAKKNLKPKGEVKTEDVGYNPSGNERMVWEQYSDRKAELLASRNDVHGEDLDQRMIDMDKLYFNRDAMIAASKLDINQSPVAINNAFGKVQTALGVIIDRDPDIELEAGSQLYVANTELMRALSKKSWQRTDSLEQFKLLVFNTAKRGWGIGRTYNKVVSHTARVNTGTDNDKTFEETTITKLDDVAYETLDNHNAWVDRAAKPYDMYSIRDWMYRKVWHIDDVRRMFPENEYPNMKFVSGSDNVPEKPDDSGNTTTSNNNNAATSSNDPKKNQVELLFYENQYDDWFIVEINGVMVVWEPLPQNHKRLSLVLTQWALRSAETIYGIGIIEAMERNEEIIDRILNMNLRQLVMSINPPGFYQGTDNLEDEDIEYEAGTLKKTINPSDIKFLQVPPMKREGFEVMDFFDGKNDETTGVSKNIEGFGKSNTAFEAGTNREASLRRLRIPIKSLQYALTWETQNRIDLIRQIYSIPTVKRIVDKELIQAYLLEVNKDREFYFIENEGEAGEEQFFANEFRELNLNVDQDDTGNFIEADSPKFFKISPKALAWEGDIHVKMDSILMQSKELEKADTIQMANIVIPMIQTNDAASNLKPAREVLLAFGKDPRRWFPDEWITQMDTGAVSGVDTRVKKDPAPKQEQGQEQEQGVPGADKAISESELGRNQGGQGGISRRISRIFRGNR